MSRSVRRTSRFARWAAHILRTDERTIEAWERLILTSFAVTLLVYGARTAHLLRGVETRWLDLMASADHPKFDAPITVVAITDADYHDATLFDGMSPLHPKALTRILEGVLAHRPRGVVLDVQIQPAAHESADRAAARLRLYQMLERASASGPPVVLIRDFAAEGIEQSTNDTLRTAWTNLCSNSRLVWADASIERSGGFVRALPRYNEVSHRPAPALPTVLGGAITAFGLVPHRSVPRWAEEEEHPSAPWRIRYTGLFLEEAPPITPYRTDVRALLSIPLVPGQSSILTDRIVLVGGVYLASRDFQPTVLGDMAGVYVWAEAIASWIRHDALREPLAPITFALEFLIGVVAGLLLVRFDAALGLLLSVLIITPLTVLFSLLTFGDRVLFVSFLPSFLGVYLHYQVELHYKIRHLKREIQLLEGVAKTSSALPVQDEATEN